VTADSHEDHYEDSPAGDDDSALATEAEVVCPYCGETNLIAIDPLGGHAQEYIEDCQVCCRPCRIQVSYDDDNTLEVTLERAE